MDRNDKIKPIMSRLNEPVIPAVFDESLSYMEMVAKIKHKVNETVGFVNTKGEEIDGKIEEANNVISEMSKYDDKVNFALNNLINIEDNVNGVSITRGYYASGSEPPIAPVEAVVAKQSDVDILNNAVLPAEYEMPLVRYDEVNQKFTFSFFDNKNNIKEVFTGLRRAIDDITTYCNLYFSRKTDVENKASNNVVCVVWDSSVTYEVDSLCIFANSLWKCLVQNTNITPFEGEYWTKTNVVTEIKRDSSSSVNYSLEEQDTGKKWIDGKTIYSKTIDCGDNFVLSTISYLAKTFMIPDNIKMPINAKFIVKSDNDFGFCNANFSYYENAWHYGATENWSAQANRHVYFYIEYTKNRRKYSSSK